MTVVAAAAAAAVVTEMMTVVVVAVAVAVVTDEGRRHVTTDGEIVTTIGEMTTDYDRHHDDGSGVEVLHVVGNAAEARVQKRQSLNRRIDANRPVGPDQLLLNTRAKRVQDLHLPRTDETHIVHAHAQPPAHLPALFKGIGFQHPPFSFYNSSILQFLMLRNYNCN